MPPDSSFQPNLDLTTAFVAGLFSLLGAFAGAFLSRRTEYMKWLRQNRSEVFGEFLSKLFQAQSKAIEVLHNGELEARERDIRVTELYSVPENYARVVRLYLPRSRREEFSRLVREVWVLHSSEKLGDPRLTKMNEKIDRLQAIFEEAIADGSN